MDETESKLLAEALNKCDKLTEIVQLLQQEITILKDTMGELVETAQKADSLLADELTELRIKVEMQQIEISALLRAPGQ